MKIKVWCSLFGFSLGTVLLFSAKPVQAADGAVFRGPIMPLTPICSDFETLYPNQQVTDNGDGILTTVRAYPNLVYAGYRDDYRDAPYTLVIYGIEFDPEPPIPPNREACWKARVNYLIGDPGKEAYLKADLCYSSLACLPRPTVGKTIEK